LLAIFNILCDDIKKIRQTSPSQINIDVGFVGLHDDHFFRAMSFLSAELCADVDIVQLEAHRLGEKIKGEGTRWKKKE
jgi:uncharacterized protein (UPF0262 family)